MNQVPALGSTVDCQKHPETIAEDAEYMLSERSSSSSGSVEKEEGRKMSSPSPISRKDYNTSLMESNKLTEVCNHIKQEKRESKKLDKFDAFLANEKLKRFTVNDKQLPKKEELLTSVCGSHKCHVEKPHYEVNPASNDPFDVSFVRKFAAERAAYKRRTEP